jgi:hypothetical protein
MLMVDFWGPNPFHENVLVFDGGRPKPKPQLPAPSPETVEGWRRQAQDPNSALNKAIDANLAAERQKQQRPLTLAELKAWRDFGLDYAAKNNIDLTKDGPARANMQAIEAQIADLEVVQARASKEDLLNRKKAIEKAIRDHINKILERYPNRNRNGLGPGRDWLHDEHGLDLQNPGDVVRELAKRARNGDKAAQGFLNDIGLTDLEKGILNELLRQLEEVERQLNK